VCEPPLGSEDPTHVLGILRIAKAVIEASGPSRGDRKLTHTATDALRFDLVHELSAQVESPRIFINGDLLQLCREPVGREEACDSRQGIAANSTVGILGDEEKCIVIVSIENRCVALVKRRANWHEGCAELTQKVEDGVSIGRCRPAHHHDQRPKLPR
jgi:hypothetical protein